MDEKRNPLGEVVARALADAAFKERLIADPEAVLAAEGVAVPAGIALKVVADSAEVRHLVLPAAGAGVLADAELESIAGGVCGEQSEVCQYLYNDNRA